MITIEANLTKFEQAMQELRKVPRWVRQELVTNAMKKGNRIFTQGIKDLAPMRPGSGRLKKRVRQLIKEVGWAAVEGRTISIPFYARFVEFGHKKVRIKRVPTGRRWPKVRRIVEVTGFVAPRPYMSRTFETRKMIVELAMAAALEKAIRKIGKQ